MTRSSVEVFHWNPRRFRLPGRLGHLGRFGPRVNNFGDLLGPAIVTELLLRAAVDPSVRRTRQHSQLLSVGSVMHFAHDGAVVWGTGVNGKALDLPAGVRTLDVRAVRGPLTAALLAKQGFHVPEVYGDPGLLVGELWTRAELAEGRTAGGVCVIPNLNDLPQYRSESNVLDPRSPLPECLARIASSELVVGSSLHGIIIAESLGIPARLIASNSEPDFKYRDYYAGSGRSSFKTAGDVRSAIRMGGEAPISWSSTALLAAFPYDLWEVPADVE
jgi:pyruvyltransferase